MELNLQHSIEKTSVPMNQFILNLHKLWMADLFDMDYYMSILEALMLKENVRWKAIVELDTENLTRSISLGFEVENMFEYDVNDKSKDEFINFAAVCHAYMDFSQMFQLQERVAA